MTTEYLAKPDKIRTSYIAHFQDLIYHINELSYEIKTRLKFQSTLTAYPNVDAKIQVNGVK